MQFRSIADNATLGKVDKAAGRIPGVSLLTADREATGWGIWVDQKTLESFQAILSGRRIKAYATHGSWGRDGTLDEVGIWDTSRVDGKNLRADFSSLDAWRKHRENEFDTLFELAEKLPEEFGASLSFRYRAVWVSKNGTEVETARKWRYVRDEGYEEYWEPAMPADAVREMPSVRAVDVYSADFVDQPAANDGLFHAGPRAASVDGAPNGISQAPASTQPTQLSMDIKTLHAKFGASPARLAAAIALFAANDKLTVDQLEGELNAQDQRTELIALRGKNEQLGKFNEFLEKAGFKASGDKSAVEILIAEHAALKAKATAHDTDEAALKVAGFEAKDGKSAATLALAALAKAATDIATLRAGGTVAVQTEATPGGAPKKLSGIALREATLREQLENQNKKSN